MDGDGGDGSVRLLDVTFDNNSSDDEDGNNIEQVAGNKTSRDTNNNNNNNNSSSSNNKNSTRCLLVTLYMTLLTQWVIMSLISSFFPESAIGKTIDTAMQGIIFSSFPVGSMVGAPCIGVAMKHLGKRVSQFVQAPPERNKYRPHESNRELGLQ